MERRMRQPSGSEPHATGNAVARNVLGGRYRLLSKIGRGGMGVVYRAEDQTLGGATVAIKRLLPSRTDDLESLARLRKEALVTLKLRHPNIVTLRQFEEIDGEAFLVMDYVDGESLEDRLRRDGRLSRREILHSFGPVAEALDYAHAQGVIHRDVKPGNILLAANGEPRLTDFGIARQLSTVVHDKASRRAMGTLPYMSPEQLGGDTPTSAQDVYSLAATMYHCLAGHPPFHEGNLEAQIFALPPKSPAPDDSPFARTILLGLSKDPRARPRSCQELVARASAIPQRRRTTARRATPPRRRWNPAVAAAAAAAALVVVLGSVIAWPRASSEPATPTTPVADTAPRLAAPSAGPLREGRLAARITSPVAGARLDTKTVRVVGHVLGSAETVLVNGNRVRLESGHFDTVAVARDSGPFRIVVESETGEVLAARRTVIAEERLDPESLVMKRILAEAEEARRLAEAQLRALEGVEQGLPAIEGFDLPEPPKLQKLEPIHFDPPKFDPGRVPQPDSIEVPEPPKPVPVPAARPGVPRWRDELLRKRGRAGNSGLPPGR